MFSLKRKSVPRNHSTRNYVAFAALIFTITCVVTLVVGLGLTTVRALVSRGGQTVRVNQTVDNSIPKLPTQLEKDLADSFEPQLPADVMTPADPFVDHANLNRNPNAIGAAANQSLSPLPGSSRMSPTSGSSSAATSPSSDARVSVAEKIAQGNRARLEMRARAKREGLPVRPVAEYLSYQDLLPVVSAGTRDVPEVLLYSVSTGESFYARAGTKLLDAELVTIRNEGVAFRDAAGKNHSVAWSRRPLTTATTAAPASRQTPENSSPVVQPHTALTDTIGNLQNAVRLRRYPPRSSPR